MPTTPWRGFRVFPLIENSKKPAIKDWPALATTDEDQIRQWWAPCPVTGWPSPLNIGVLTGYDLTDFGIPGGWLTVIDIDVKNDGMDNWNALIAERGYPGIPLMIVRTPSGGRHLYFATLQRFGNSAGKLGRGIDVRGKHGYVVGPGSTIDDKEYTIEANNILDKPLFT